METFEEQDKYVEHIFKDDAYFGDTLMFLDTANVGDVIRGYDRPPRYKNEEDYQNKTNPEVWYIEGVVLKKGMIGNRANGDFEGYTIQVTKQIWSNQDVTGETERKGTEIRFVRYERADDEINKKRFVDAGLSRVMKIDEETNKQKGETKCHS